MAQEQRAPRRTTIGDIAARAGVSKGAVSYALNQRPGISDETRERILTAARELHYRPNALARGLRTRRTDTIGLIIPSLDNLGFSDVTHGIQGAAAAAGKLVMVVDAGAVRLQRGVALFEHP